MNNYNEELIPNPATLILKAENLMTSEKGTLKGT